MNIIKEMPEAKNDFLRFQIGRMETRPSVVPKYGDGGKFLGLENGGPVSVFRLLGFGSTLERAQQMAKRRALA